MNMVYTFICCIRICCLGIADLYGFRAWTCLWDLKRSILSSTRKWFIKINCKANERVQRKKTASIGSFSDYIPFKPLTKSDDESWVAPPPAASVLNSKVNSATVSCSCIQVNRCSSASLPLGDVWRQNKLTTNHMSSDSLPWIYVTSCIHSCSEVICQKRDASKTLLHKVRIMLV